MSDEIETLKEAEKEKMSFTDSDFAPHQITTHKEAEHNHWMGGIVLITVGIVLLMTMVLGYSIHNWWALFILAPGLSKLVYAVQGYQSDGRFSPCTRNNFIGGLVLTLIACIFFFGWNWGAIWPVFLIIFGAGALLSGLLE